ncbi:hypothetical protein [Methylocaldum sp.]|uniref:hypothetical protein n=1 Tax=Methylocaldum sp. TaxID=1969727 RepID=UPI002D24D233|nr:hypothetical protein [Methylocaldum sp.]HYE35510.1 hypothetical protein [Methylocaldum sp.]
MAYQTGTANTAAALKSAFETFLTTNGWALSGGVLSKGGSNIRLTDVSASGNQVLRLEGANNAAFTVGVCTQGAKLIVSDVNWPLTYHFFVHASPDTAFCIVNYNVNYHQFLGFGDIDKLHASAYTGGNFIAGTWGDNGVTGSIGFTPLASGSATSVGDLSGGFNALFWNNTNRSASGGTYAAACASFLHAEIDGAVWPGDGVEGSRRPSFPLHAAPLMQRGVNAWNQQAVLLPFHLWLPRPSIPATYSYLGAVAHCRALRLANYNPGDLITIGSDRWKVFPWFLKDATHPEAGGNGTGTHSWESTGVYGWAIEYDGP